MVQPPVLVLSGPPGAGKSTAARLVAERGSPSVCLESDWFWSTIVNGFVQPWLPEAAHQTRVIASAYAAAAARLARGGYFVVLDGVIGPWLMPIVKSEFSEAGVGLVYIILRPTREVAIARGVSRAGQEEVVGLPALVDPGPIGELWDRFADLDDSDAIVIDTTHLDPPAAAAAIWQRYESR